MTLKILDATCGCRSMWYQENHPWVTYMDIREGDYSCAFIPSKNRTVSIHPTIKGDFQNTPFDSDHFDMIVFDPPHIIRKGERKTSFLENRYGALKEDNYRVVLANGFKELFRILKPEGTFILKWAEIDKPLKEILSLCPYPPLFGTQTGQKNKNHWVLFIKHSLDGKLEEFA